MFTQLTQPPAGLPIVLGTQPEQFSYLGKNLINLPAPPPLVVAGVSITGSGLVTGGAGNDTLTGANSNDTIIGGAGNDIMRGIGGDDNYEGGSGSDTIIGGNGTNVLTGADDATLGAGEIDNLVGGGYGSTNIFPVGNSTQSYYVGNGDGDYANISKFDAGSDLIVLAGQASDYSISYSNGTALIYKLVAGNAPDLIAKIENAPTGLDLVNGSYFYYVEPPIPPNPIN
jgi:Ca2+-binding RTX toxin-like protein